MGITKIQIYLFEMYNKIFNIFGVQSFPSLIVKQHSSASARPSALSASSPLSVRPKCNSVNLRNSAGAIQLVALHEEEEETEREDKGGEGIGRDQHRDRRTGNQTTPKAMHPRVAALQLGEQRRPSRIKGRRAMIDPFKTSMNIGCSLFKNSL